MSLQISMPLYKGKSNISITDVADYLREKWTDIPEISETSSKDNVHSFSIGDGFVAVLDNDVPFPWSDLEGPCATSILWKNAEEDLKDHDSHIIVSVNIDSASEVEVAALLTKVTDAVMETTENCLGVYWGNATMVIPKHIFNEFTQKILPQGPPVHIWIDFRVGPDENNTSTGFTTGLAALGLMEIEAVKTPEQFNMLRDRLTGLADYLIVNGPVIKDGDTVGEDKNEMIKVKYSNSQFGFEGKVMNLLYEKAKVKKSFFKFW